MNHGTPTAYDRGKCRCVDCTMANRERHRKLLEQRASRPIPAGIHGKHSTYTNYRCRCEPCREANREHAREYKRWLKSRNR